MPHAPLQHIAYIMDGNRRWARHSGCSYEEAIRAGIEALKRVLKACRDRDIKYVTIYAFSTDNWKRTPSERTTLFGVFSSVFAELEALCRRHELATRFIGNQSAFPKDIQKNCRLLEEKTLDYRKYYLDIALSYGSREELCEAFMKMQSLGEVPSPKNLGRFLYTWPHPDPDVLVRTAGEYRLSNFLLWQLAYTEFFFLKKYWPDVQEEDIHHIIDCYRQRDRRYGL